MLYYIFKVGRKYMKWNIFFKFLDILLEVDIVILIFLVFLVIK